MSGFIMYGSRGVSITLSDSCNNCRRNERNNTLVPSFREPRKSENVFKDPRLQTYFLVLPETRLG